MVRDLRLLAFWRILDFGGVGQTDKVLLAFVSGLLVSSTRLLVEPLLEDAGKEKAMFRHLSGASLDVRIDDFFV